MEQGDRLGTDRPTSRSGEHYLLAYRVEQHEAWIAETRAAIRSIDQSLQALASVGAGVAANRAQIVGLDARLMAIEIELPTLKLARKWVLAAMTSGGAAIGAAVLALVMK